jgi:protein CpxP
MKRQITALIAACFLGLGAFTIAQLRPTNDPQPNNFSEVANQGASAQDSAEEGSGRHGKGRHGWGKPFEKLTEKLDLTDDQKAKVQPIVDQAKPQIEAIHRDAMQKTKTIMDNTMAQIRPLLTPEQQQKLDSMQKEHGDMGHARKEKRDAENQ